VQDTASGAGGRTMGGIGAMKRSRLRKSFWAATLVVSAAAALALAACGSDSAPTDLPTRTTPVPALSYPVTI
jgi:hypothetical protein